MSNQRSRKVRMGSSRRSLHKSAIWPPDETKKKTRTDSDCMVKENTDSLQLNYSEHGNKLDSKHETSKDGANEFTRELSGNRALTQMGMLPIEACHEMEPQMSKLVNDNWTQVSQGSGGEFHPRLDSSFYSHLPNQPVTDDQFNHPKPLSDSIIHKGEHGSDIAEENANQLPASISMKTIIESRDDIFQAFKGISDDVQGSIVKAHEVKDGVNTLTQSETPIQSIICPLLQEETEQEQITNAQCAPESYTTGNSVIFVKSQPLLTIQNNTTPVQDNLKIIKSDNLNEPEPNITENSCSQVYESEGQVSNDLWELIEDPVIGAVQSEYSSTSAGDNDHILLIERSENISLNYGTLGKQPIEDEEPENNSGEVFREKNNLDSTIELIDECNNDNIPASTAHLLTLIRNSESEENQVTGGKQVDLTFPSKLSKYLDFEGRKKKMGSHRMSRGQHYHKDPPESNDHRAISFEDQPTPTESQRQVGNGSDCLFSIPTQSVVTQERDGEDITDIEPKEKNTGETIICLPPESSLDEDDGEEEESEQNNTIPVLKTLNERKKEFSEKMSHQYNEDYLCKPAPQEPDPQEKDYNKPPGADVPMLVQMSFSKEITPSSEEINSSVLFVPVSDIKNNDDNMDTVGQHPPADVSNLEQISSPENQWSLPNIKDDDKHRVRLRRRKMGSSRWTKGTATVSKKGSKEPNATQDQEMEKHVVKSDKISDDDPKNLNSKDNKERDNKVVTYDNKPSHIGSVSHQSMSENTSATQDIERRKLNSSQEIQEVDSEVSADGKLFKDELKKQKNKDNDTKQNGEKSSETQQYPPVDTLIRNSESEENQVTGGKQVDLTFPSKLSKYLDFEGRKKKMGSHRMSRGQHYHKDPPESNDHRAISFEDQPTPTESQRQVGNGSDCLFSIPTQSVVTQERDGEDITDIEPKEKNTGETIICLPPESSLDEDDGEEEESEQNNTIPVLKTLNERKKEFSEKMSHQYNEDYLCKPAPQEPDPQEKDYNKPPGADVPMLVQMSFSKEITPSSEEINSSVLFVPVSDIKNNDNNMDTVGQHPPADVSNLEQISSPENQWSLPNIKDDDNRTQVSQGSGGEFHPRLDSSFYSHLPNQPVTDDQFNHPKPLSDSIIHKGEHGSDIAEENANQLPASISMKTIIESRDDIFQAFKGISDDVQGSIVKAHEVKDGVNTLTQSETPIQSIICPLLQEETEQEQITNAQCAPESYTTGNSVIFVKSQPLLTIQNNTTPVQDNLKIIKSDNLNEPEPNITENSCSQVYESEGQVSNDLWELIEDPVIGAVQSEYSSTSAGDNDHILLIERSENISLNYGTLGKQPIEDEEPENNSGEVFREKNNLDSTIELIDECNNDNIPASTAHLLTLIRNSESEENQVTGGKQVDLTFPSKLSKYLDFEGRKKKMGSHRMSRGQHYHKDPPESNDHRAISFEDQPTPTESQRQVGNGSDCLFSIPTQSVVTQERDGEDITDIEPKEKNTGETIICLPPESSLDEDDGEEEESEQNNTIPVLKTLNERKKEFSEKMSHQYNEDYLCKPAPQEPDPQEKDYNKPPGADVPMLVQMSFSKEITPSSEEINSSVLFVPVSDIKNNDDNMDTVGQHPPADVSNLEQISSPENQWSLPNIKDDDKHRVRLRRRKMGSSRWTKGTATVSKKGSKEPNATQDQEMEKHVVKSDKISDDDPKNLNSKDNKERDNKVVTYDNKPSHIGSVSHQSMSENTSATQDIERRKLNSSQEIQEVDSEVSADGKLFKDELKKQKNKDNDTKQNGEKSSETQQYPPVDTLIRNSESEENQVTGGKQVDLTFPSKLSKYLDFEGRKKKMGSHRMSRGQHYHKDPPESNDHRAISFEDQPTPTESQRQVGNGSDCLFSIPTQSVVTQERDGEDITDIEPKEKNTGETIICLPPESSLDEDDGEEEESEQNNTIPVLKTLNERKKEFSEKMSHQYNEDYLCKPAPQEPDPQEKDYNKPPGADVPMLVQMSFSKEITPSSEEINSSVLFVPVSDIKNNDDNMDTVGQHPPADVSNLEQISSPENQWSLPNIKDDDKHRVRLRRRKMGSSRWTKGTATVSKKGSKEPNATQDQEMEKHVVKSDKISDDDPKNLNSKDNKERDNKVVTYDNKPSHIGSVSHQSMSENTSATQDIERRKLNSSQEIQEVDSEVSADGKLFKDELKKQKNKDNDTKQNGEKSSETQQYPPVDTLIRNSESEENQVTGGKQVDLTFPSKLSKYLDFEGRKKKMGSHRMSRGQHYHKDPPESNDHRAISFEDQPTPTESQSQQITGNATLTFDTSNKCDLRANIFDVVMVGSSNVGKTSFVKRVQSGSFSSDFSASIGIDMCVHAVPVDGREVILQLWDTAGQERFHSISKQIFHKGQAFLLMYDITSFKSFSDVRYWISCIQESARDDVTMLLLGNKSDCAARQVNPSEGQRLAKEHNIDFNECSAATGEHIVSSMEYLARMLTEKYNKMEEGIVVQEQKTRTRCC